MNATNPSAMGSRCDEKMYFLKVTHEHGTSEYWLISNSKDDAVRTASRSRPGVVRVEVLLEEKA